MMTYDEAIEKLLNSCANYESIVKLLQEQNAFLTETIVKYNLGKINKERKSLYDSINRIKKETAFALKNADSESIYLEELEAEPSNEMLKEKQDDLNAYINSRIDNQIQKIKEELSDYKVLANDRINSYIQENENLKSQNLLYQDENRKLKILVGIIICVFIIYIFITRTF